MGMDEVLARVRRPSRYAGGEVNSVHKHPADMTCRVALAYPDLYELAMSYLGLQVLYAALNREPDLWAERVFTPEDDMRATLRKRGLKLPSLESSTALDEFDMVGFSLQHELNYPDVLNMLHMGGIPEKASERTNRHPLVVAGGPGAANPEPLAPALDAVLLGDGEEGIVEMARAVGAWRASGLGRSALLDQLMEIPGVYIPSRYRVTSGTKGGFAGTEALEGAPARVRRRLLLDLEQSEVPPEPVVASRQPVHERLTVEIQRGCTRGCRFCQAGMINRPVRQRSAGQILQAIDRGLQSTGHAQVSLLSLSAGDHPRILDMLESLYRLYGQKRISISLPSLRAETLSGPLAELVKTVRKSGFTIAPEAGTQRLRQVINKNLGDEEIIEAARSAFSAGWQGLKLYFMIGLPTETAADHAGIVALVERLVRESRSHTRRARIHVGISTFVPKPHTPFQWEPMIGPARAHSILHELRGELSRLPGVRVSWTKPEMSRAEGILSRGDRRHFESLQRLANCGQSLCGWTENFDKRIFDESFAGTVDFQPDGSLGARELDAILPWSHLDMGPSAEFLLAERQRALMAEQTPDCSQGQCTDCGACLPEGAIPVLDSSGGALPVPEGAPEPVARGHEAQPDHALIRVRLIFAKQGRAVHLSHIEFMNEITRALRRAAWPLIYSRGFHPKPQLSFGPACQVGVASTMEMVDVKLHRLGPGELSGLQGGLSDTLFPGISLLKARSLDAREPGIMKAATGIRYSFSPRNDTHGCLDQEQAIRRAVSELIDRQQWLVTRTVKGKLKTVDLRPSLGRLELIEAGKQPKVMCDLRLNCASTARPNEIRHAVFDECDVRIVREAILFGAKVHEKGTTEP